MTFGSSGGFSNIEKRTLTLGGGSNLTVYTCPVGTVAYVKLGAYHTLGQGATYYINPWDKVNSAFALVPLQYGSSTASFASGFAVVTPDVTYISTNFSNGFLQNVIYAGTGYASDGVIRLTEGDRITAYVSGGAKITIDLQEQTAA